MKKTVIIIALALLLPAIHAEQKQTKQETLAVATFVVGEVFYERAGSEKRVFTKTIFYEGDRVFTKKGKIDMQVGPHAVVHLSEYSAIEMDSLAEMGDSRQIALKLSKGAAYSKIVKKLDKDSSFRINSPTLAAGVRGTEFVVSEQTEQGEDQDVESGVYVNEGEVAVTDSSTGEEAALIGQEQVVKKGEELKKGILDAYMKRKMEIFAGLDVMKEKNYNLLKNQKDRNQAAIDRIRQKHEELKQKMGEY